MPGKVPGSTRKVRLSESRHAAALEVLRRVTHPATLPVPRTAEGLELEPSEPVLLRFPCIEFRSLLLNAIGRDSFPDRAVWKRHKVDLARLLLQLAEGDAAGYEAGLERLAAACLKQGGAGAGTGQTHVKPGSRRARSLARRAAAAAAAAAEAEAGAGAAAPSALASAPAPVGLAPAVPAGSPEGSVDGSESDGAGPGAGAEALRAAPEPQLQGQGQPPPLPVSPHGGHPYAQPHAHAHGHPRGRSPAERLAARRAQIDAWCRCVAGGAAFAGLRPLLARVLGLGEPTPLVDVRRNGSQTELQVAALMEGQLPEGWRLYGQATIVRVDGAPFPNRKHLKGEADLLLVDPEGVVQAVVEVKTAKGNPYVALYEDVGKLLALLRAVRGRAVTFRHGAGTELVTARFSKRLRPIYVLGCGGAALGLAGATVPSAAAAAAAASSPPFGIGLGAGPAPPGAPCPSPVLRSAWTKLLTMELGRELSGAGAAAAAAEAEGGSGGGGGPLGAWSALSVEALSREAVVLALPGCAYPPLARRVSHYFARLAHCAVYLLEPGP
ncbi:hypothetical protein HYH03_012364 [Edaphochlamys debaryana]|uniref:Uncharacterized protein n=1 Tax=Edaphochlamys debaryana TaxID=47281 RepID=A0A835XRZ5_9CHLO|nr:hypothetical protein HYH03_012364 [Edaphochlamys debaryana]|eukprot:KAG2489138.1 hypothetical protein HYH03_012364 [Edaphochlamys debaryana]